MNKSFSEMTLDDLYNLHYGTVRPQIQKLKENIEKDYKTLFSILHELYPNKYPKDLPTDYEGFIPLLNKLTESELYNGLKAIQVRNPDGNFTFVDQIHYVSNKGKFESNNLLQYYFKRYITNIDLIDIIDTERLGRYLFDKYDLKEYTPSKIGEIRKALKLSPEYPFDAIQFIGDYEDYEDFKVSDERKQFLDSHSKEIQIMEDSKLYKDKEESQLDMSNENFFYGRIAYNYIRVVHHIFRFFFQDEYPVFRKFLDLEELANQILTRAFYTEGDFYFKRDIAN